MSREKGAALITAMAAVLILSITASVVMGLTWRRMQMSANRKDHMVAVVASDAGLQYVFARLQLDPTFDDTLRNQTDALLVVSPLAGPVTILINGIPTSVTVDQQVPGLQLGNKDVHVAIELDPADAGTPVAQRRLKIHSNANYGI